MVPSRSLVTILCYHEVHPEWRSPLAVTPEDLAEHMAWLTRARRVLDLDAAIAAMDRRGRLPRGTAAVTFDDGFSGVYDHAFRLLAGLRIPATVFLVAATLEEGGKAVDWVRTPPSWPLRTLTIEEVRELRAAGIRFGSHSHAHRILTELGEEECERDLRRSREVLEDLLGEPVTTLAYPGGRHDRSVRRAARRAGFGYAFALPERREMASVMSIPRVGVYRGNGVRDVRLKSGSWYLPIRTSSAYAGVRRVLGRRPSPPPG